MNNKMTITTSLSIITLNINGLNTLKKRHRVAKVIGDLLQIKRHTLTESKGMERYFIQIKAKKKKAEVPIIMFDKVDFKTKYIIRDRK